MAYSTTSARPARSLRREPPSREAPAYSRGKVTLCLGDAQRLYGSWPAPTVIMVDGPYGVAGFPGDPPGPEGMAEWYRPHVASWSERALPETTLWFWGTEVGWATVHPVLAEHGWEYAGCNIWDKGMAHVAGNCNTKTLRRFPVVTEVCVQYVRPPTFRVDGRELSMKAWLRWEWQRTGMPLSKTNDACGVKNAATRKYFTQDHVWYFPPPEAMARLVEYANAHGRPAGKPYFSLDGAKPLTAENWARMRSKFHLKAGVTNVWSEPALRGDERIRVARDLGHPNQKPLKLIHRLLETSSDPQDVIWEPFGGLCTTAIAAHTLTRECYSAELLPGYYELAVERLKRHGRREV